MTWIDPVFDRTVENVRYGDPKGSLTPETLNRIENNVDVLVSLFDEQHLPREKVTRQAQEWIRTNYFYLENFNAIKFNVMGLKKAKIHWVDTPSLHDSIFGDGITYEELNDVERILFDIYMALKGLGMRTRVLGTFTTGTNTQRQYIRCTR